MSQLMHTAGSDTIFIQIYMNALPRVSGVSKNQNFFLQIKLLSFCTKIAPKRKYQGFSICFWIFLSGGTPYNFFQIIENKDWTHLYRFQA